MPRSVLRRLFGAASALLLAVLVVGGSAGAAQAEDGYRYWNYFHEKNGSWEFSQTSASDHTPADGAVEAYRYGTSLSAGIEPRVDLDQAGFAAICAETEATGGEKRVGVLLDFGTEADAEGETPPTPRGECAVVAEDSNGQQVLDAVSEVRAEKGLTCAIDGYPVKGCGVPVSNAEVAADEQPVAFVLPSDSDTGEAEAADEGDRDLLWPLVGVGLLVVVIGAAALMLSRRNKSA